MRNYFKDVPTAFYGPFVPGTYRSWASIFDELIFNVGQDHGHSLLIMHLSRSSSCASIFGELILDVGQDHGLLSLMS